MKITTVAAALVLGIGVVSCNENEQPKPQTQQRQGFLQSMQGQQFQHSPNATVTGPRDVNIAGPTGLPAIPANTAAPSRQSASAEPQLIIPKDARWTLYCSSIAGADRFSRAAELKAYLVANTPFKDWYVVHNENDSTLFYGFYQNIEKQLPGAAKAHKDRQAISEWRDKSESRPFATCFLVPITPPNPVAPAEWNLVNAPQRAYWSVQVAAFMDNPLRKQAAVERVQELRDKGVEAYYYHGPTISSVCVGAWPANALKQQDEDAGRAVNPEAVPMVIDGPLPERYRGAKIETKEGQQIVPYAQRVEIVDPSLDATMKEYPQHVVNYQVKSRQVRAANGQMKDVVSPSFLVVIPRADTTVLNGGGGEAAAPSFMNQRGAASSGQAAETRGLRGLGNDLDRR